MNCRPFIPLLVLVGLLSGCTEPGADVKPIDARLTRAASCDDLVGRMRSDAEAKVRSEAGALLDGYDAYVRGDGYGPILGGPFLAEGGAPTDGAADASGPSHYTDTNTQVAGVDEPDFVETDGTRIFVLHGDSLVVMKSWPADQTAEVGSLEIEGSPTSMFLSGEKVVVFSHVSFVAEPTGVGTVAPPGIPMADVAWGPYFPYSDRAFTKITVLDVTDDTPSVISERYVEGWFQDARRHGQVVRAFVTSPTWQPQWGGPYPSVWGPDGALLSRFAFQQAVRVWLTERLSAVASRSLEEFLPDEFVREGDALVPVTARCEGFYVPTPGETPYGMVQVLALRLDDLATTDSVFVLGQPSVIYASHDALVLAQSQWSWDVGLSTSEHRTLVHELGIAGASTPYIASGVVAGGVLNQFSIDEHEGVLRLALTEERYDANASPFVWTPPRLLNRVVTLGADDGELVELGRTPDLAEGERIYSVRYIGDRGYVVTFLQVDPLFVIDLANPLSPTVLGEVKIPGFSTYMHPLSETHLLTIGRYVDPMGGFTQGMQLQIFDVSDASAPTRTQSLILDDAYSAAESDHKAFVYDAVSGLLAIPVDQYDLSFESTLRLFEVSLTEGFTEAGTIDHSGFFGDCFDGSPYYGCGYSASMRRGLFIDDYVYALSYGGLTVHGTADVTTPLAAVALPAPEFYPYYYWGWELDAAW